MKCNENIENNEKIECNEDTACEADMEPVSSETQVCPHCSGKHTQRDEAQKKLLQNRLRRIEGQVRGLQSMLDQDAYCNDILVQSAAVSAALNAFNRELLENHIRHCVARDIREGKDEVIDELMGTLKKLMK